MNHLWMFSNIKKDNKKKKKIKKETFRKLLLVLPHRVKTTEIEVTVLSQNCHFLNDRFCL